MKQVSIYTDGACSGNPGPGGWGAVLLYGQHKKEISGGEPSTTNNRMELTAVIAALSMLKEPCAVDLYSDSKYVIDALEKGWARGWKKRGWVKSDKKPALNPDLWEQLLALVDVHQLTYHWVKGHAENAYNNRCDELAVGESRKFRGPVSTQNSWFVHCFLAFCSRIACFGALSHQVFHIFHGNVHMQGRADPQPQYLG